MIVKTYKRGYTHRVIIETVYGLCDQSKQDYIKGVKPTIKCAVDKTKYFIKKAQEVHGELYDYSEVIYKNNSAHIKIKCKKHGEFLQSPALHLSGANCYSCSVKTNAEKRTKTTVDFIKQANAIHNFKYDYQFTVYTKNSVNIKIICPIHGEFIQTPANHLKRQGCPKCGNIKKANSQRFTQESVIETFKERHNNCYDYSKVVYTGIKNLITIICPVHGDFEQKAESHLKGYGCYLCNGGFSKRSYVASTPSGSSIYLLLFTLENSTKFCKLGISKNISDRINTIRKEYNLKANVKLHNIEILFQYFNKDSGIIFDLEKKYKNSFKSYKYKTDINFSGSSECFSFENSQFILNTLKKEIKD